MRPTRGTPTPQRSPSASSGGSEAPYRAQRHRPLVGFRSGAGTEFHVTIVKQVRANQRQIPPGANSIPDPYVHLAVRINRRQWQLVNEPEEGVDLQKPRQIDVRAKLEDVVRIVRFR